MKKTLLNLSLALCLSTFAHASDSVEMLPTAAEARASKVAPEIAAEHNWDKEWMLENETTISHSGSHVSAGGKSSTDRLCFSAGNLLGGRALIGQLVLKVEDTEDNFVKAMKDAGVVFKEMEAEDAPAADAPADE